MKNIKTIFVIITLLSIFSQQACSSTLRELKQDADALCQVYNPANWEEFAKSHTQFEIYPELGKRIRKAIKTPEFYGIFKKYLHVNDQSYHDFMTSQISHLIGKKWHCAYFDKFETSQSIKVLRLRTEGIHQLDSTRSSDTIVSIAIDGNGKYYVNDKPLINNKEDTLRQAIRMTAGKSKDINILVRADSNSPSALLIQLLYVAKTLHIKFVDFEVQ